ncbi:MAG: hypothetical protein AB7S38_11230 [Vulcanimicrobiota bacterium]
MKGLLLAAILLTGCADDYSKKLATELADDLRNAGIEVSLRAKGEMLVVDLLSVSGERSPADVTRVLFTAAALVVKEHPEPYQEVVLEYRKGACFKLSGQDFYQLGKDFEAGENPVYLIRTLPEKLKTPTGKPAYEKWEGGWLGVSTRQMEDFNDFHKKWWITASTL